MIIARRPLRTRQQSISLAVISNLFIVGTMAGCTITEPLQVEPYESGVLIFNDRQQPSNVSVSFLNRQTGLTRFNPPKSGVAPTDIFNNLNSRQLNDVVFSYAEIDGKGFLVQPEKGIIEIVQGSSFRSIALMGGTSEGARYIAGVNSLKAYVSCWGGQTTGPHVSVVDVVARQLRTSIPVAAGPEQMVVVNNELFVANSGGTSEVGRTVSLINTDTDQLVTTITVGDVPTSMVYDASVKLIYVLCSGRPVSQTANGLTTAELLSIDPTARKVVRRIQLGGRAIAGNPTNLMLDSQTGTLYFLYRNNIYKTTTTATTIPVDQPLQTRSLTNYGFDPMSSLLYGAARKSTNTGVILRYRASGAVVDSISTETIPTGFYFK